MQYQANPSTDFFQTSHVALPWVIYSPYISRFCGDRLTTKLFQSPAVVPQMQRFEQKTTETAVKSLANTAIHTSFTAALNCCC
jgi:hypothetical protein